MRFRRAAPSRCELQSTSEYYPNNLQPKSNESFYLVFQHPELRGADPERGVGNFDLLD